MSKDKTYPKLRGRIVEKYGSISEFSRHVSISRTNVHYKLCGKVAFSIEDMREWAGLLDIPVDEWHIFFSF